MSLFWKCAIAFVIFFQGILILRYYNWRIFNVKTAPKKFVGFHLNFGRLGNQLFHMITGYGIARAMNRGHYLPFEDAREHVEKYLIHLEEIFPRLKQTYVLAKRGTKQRNVPFSPNCCSYHDPSRLNNLTDQFLLLDLIYGQNPGYFEHYLADVRDILQFSEKVVLDGSRTLLNLTNYTSSMCIHVRLGDFIERKLATDMNVTVKAANAIARKKNLSHFMIFGDDQQFMKKMSKNIMKEGRWRNGAVAISNYTESTDLYLASQICSSFLIAAVTSTFGWWLAFFAQDQNAVYYLNDTRPHADKVPSKELFLKSWQVYPG
ncbi:unnamed protein product [Cylicocyclus nassatus]|uniref:L-Fucosyltransferase n=1 Tax=Cylicocyclus nassatus TaxID=53992 RepID=A0AA36HC88_CYLNA|nr:unnamed protein product [Cylicocyclus nassatus]